MATCVLIWGLAMLTMSMQGVSVADSERVNLKTA